MEIKVHQLRNIGHPFPLVAWIIMIVQGMNPFNKRSYSHMAISLTDSQGTYFYDASFKGVFESSKKNYRKTYKTIESVNLQHNFEDKRAFLQWFDTHKGKRYDFIQLIGLLLKLLKIRSTNHIGKDQEQLICCELVLLLLHDIKYFDMVDSDNYDLLEVWKLAKLRGVNVIP